METFPIIVPRGEMHAGEDDLAAAEQRRRIAEMLRNGETVRINSGGGVHMPGQTVEMSPSMKASGQIVDGEVELVVPTGKLANR